MGTVLVIDPDPRIPEQIGRLVDAAGLHVLHAWSGEQALECAYRSDLAIVEFNLAGMDGIHTLLRLRSTNPALIALMTSSAPLSDCTVDRALRAGFNGFFLKPWSLPEVQARITEMVRRAGVAVGRDPDSQAAERGELIGESPPMRHAFETIRNYAGVERTVLIVGETGTGKERVARLLHDLSARRSFRFMPVNCGGLGPRDLLEFVLFGHEAGAFTGVASRTTGIFEAAHRGTVFLDELGALPGEAQPALLRVMEGGEFTRLGTSVVTHVDVRVLVATNEDPEMMVDRGRLRKDLFYRLAGLRIDLPPLRDRGDDVLLLAEYFLHRDAEALGRRPSLTPEVRQALVNYPWPGNVRELESSIATALLRSRSLELTLETLPDAIIRHEHRRLLRAASPCSTPSGSRCQGSAEDTPLPYYREQWQKARQGAELRLIEEALSQARGNRSAAAQLFRCKQAHDRPQTEVGVTLAGACVPRAVGTDAAQIPGRRVGFLRMRVVGQMARLLRRRLPARSRGPRKEVVS